MRSFRKFIDISTHINGTKVKNNLPYVSSGIPSLDHIVGGGIPAGSIFVVEEDVLGVYSKVLFKYFIAEGVACDHELFVTSLDEDPHKITSELPQPCALPPEDEKAPSTDAEKMKIAWRYEGLSQVESSFGSNTNFGHNFDLSRYIDADTIEKSKIQYGTTTWQDSTLSWQTTMRRGKLKSALFHKLLRNIYETVLRSSGTNMLRLAIHSLGSPIWMAMDSDDTEFQNYGRDLIMFMYYLRILIRDKNVAVFITIPSHLYEDPIIMKKVLYSAHNAVRIESFAGSEKETNPVYKDYHGLFHITKLTALYTLVPFVPPSLDLAFKLKRKKFVIEKLHIPPELEETSEREQDDITATPSTACGGFRKKDIDF